jgi:N-acetyl-anhydromuramyl-L-alanine amidase AmpD
MLRPISLSFTGIACKRLTLCERGVCIKTIIKGLSVLLVLFVLSSCAGKQEVPTEITETTTFVDDTEYFLPVDEYSSERTEVITHVVIHFMSAIVNHPDEPYNMEHIRNNFLEYNFSAHYVIDREGIVYPFIPEARNAWHAGKGTWKEFTDNMNSRSIGIELLGIGKYEEMKQYITKSDYNKIDPADIGFTDEQYASLDLLLNDIFARNPGIGKDRDHVIGHNEYSPRKTDPGALFDWSRLTFVND